MSEVGFVGVGAMGSQIARRLIDAGHSLTIFDPNPDALMPFETSARIVESAAECGSQGVVMIMVQNDAQLTDALLGEHGLVEGIEGSGPPLIAVMSTVLPDTMLTIERSIKKTGACLIDAPVSGGPVAAREGTLTIMAGGGKSDLEEVRPLFAVLGKAIYHCGKLGSGQLTKIINNLLGVTNMFLLAEALNIARHYELDLGRLTSIMEESSGRCLGTRDWVRQLQLYQRLAASPEAVKSVTDICRKDLHHALDLARLSGSSAPLARHVLDALTETSYAEIQDQWRLLTAPPPA